MSAGPATDLQEKENAESRHLRPAASEEDSKGSSSDEKKSEDLFLNIAKTDASRTGSQISSSKLDKRRSRVSLPFFNSTRPSTGYKSSPIHERFETSSVSGRSEALNYYSKRASLGQHLPGALSPRYTPESSTKERGVETQSSHPGNFPQRAMSRRYSAANSHDNTNTEPVRTYSRSNTARTGRLVSESAFLGRPRMPEPNATESTISTTAPSTVWDELDDLKSRIKKLELTGKLPPSSAAAMTMSERPKTATTAATTMSSSPKTKPTGVTQLQSTIEGIPSNVHPNLHEALGNAKAVLSNDIFQKLQATAQDALQLSMMMNPESHNAAGSIIGVTSVTERQIRRRTESMCRALTELAIAILADNKASSQLTMRPGSRDAYQTTSNLRSPRYRSEPNDRPQVALRVQSRLESRRASGALGGTSNIPGTPPDDSYQTPPTAVPTMPSSSSSRIGRTAATLVSSRRAAGSDMDRATDDEESSPSVRPVSRAMTEVSTFRQTVRDRAVYSREYTAQHPLPQEAGSSPLHAMNTTRGHLPSHVSTHLVPRRKYAAVSSTASKVGAQQQPPATSKEPWGQISIVPTPTSSPVSASPETQANMRPPNSRRSLGFTSRISSVSSRLRAAKAERNAGIRDAPQLRGTRDITPTGEILDNRAPLERHGSGQSVKS